MISVRLAGGLGNQLFQLAAALDARRFRGDGVELETAFLRAYRAPRAADVVRLLPPAGLRYICRTRPRTVAGLMHRCRVGRVAGRYALNDRSFAAWQDGDASRSIKRLPLLLVDGYFQSGWSQERFEIVLAEMRAALPRPFVDHAGVCALHVRGGDFLDSSRHHIVSFAFYREAVVRMMDERAVRAFSILGDDKRYAQQCTDGLRQAFPAVTFSTFGPSADPLTDFERLAGCGYRIAGNSTFAWWASALGTHGGLTIAPSRFDRETPKPFRLADEYWLDVV